MIRLGWRSKSTSVCRITGRYRYTAETGLYRVAVRLEDSRMLNRSSGVRVRTKIETNFLENGFSFGLGSKYDN